MRTLRLSALALFCAAPLWGAVVSGPVDIPALPPSASAAASLGSVLGGQVLQTADAISLRSPALALSGLSQLRQSFPTISDPQQKAAAIAVMGAIAQPAVLEQRLKTSDLPAAAVKRLAAAGAEVEPLTLPDAGLLELFNTLWLASATRRVRSVPEPRRSLIDPNLIEAVKRFEGDSAVDYVDASVRRVEFASWMEALFERFDLVVSPAVTVPPFDKGRDFPVGSGMKIWTEWAGFSFPVNLSQQPACVVPCARTRDERPIGLQFIAARAADDRVLEAAAAYRALAA